MKEVEIEKGKRFIDLIVSGEAFDNVSVEMPMIRYYLN